MNSKDKAGLLKFFKSMEEFKTDYDNITFEIGSKTNYYPESEEELCTIGETDLKEYAEMAKGIFKLCIVHTNSDKKHKYISIDFFTKQVSYDKALARIQRLISHKIL